MNIRGSLFIRFFMNSRFNQLNPEKSGTYVMLYVQSNTILKYKSENV